MANPNRAIRTSARPQEPVCHRPDASTAKVTVSGYTLVIESLTIRDQAIADAARRGRRPQDWVKYALERGAFTSRMLEPAEHLARAAGAQRSLIELLGAWESELRSADRSPLDAGDVNRWQQRRDQALALHTELMEHLARFGTTMPS